MTVSKEVGIGEQERKQNLSVKATEQHHKVKDGQGHTEG